MTNEDIKDKTAKEQARNAGAPEDGDFRFGILGWGRIAGRFAAACDMLNGCRVAAIGSGSADENSGYFAAHPEVKLFRDYDELLDSGGVDGVYIAVPHIFHMQWIEKALERGIPVLCEKPMVIDPGDIIKIRDLTEKSGAICMEAFKTKFSEGYESLIKDIPLIGNIEEIETVNTLDAKTERPGGYEFKKGGGAVYDVGCYNLGFLFDIVRRAGLDPEPVSMDTVLIPEGEVDIKFRSILKLKCGIKAVSYGALDENAGRYAVIRGDRGWIEVPYFYRVNEYTVYNDEGKRTVSVPYEGNDMTEEIKAFISDVKAGRTEDPVHSLDDSGTILFYMEKMLNEGEWKKDF